MMCDLEVQPRNATHTHIHIRARSNKKKENNRFNDPLASKVHLQKALLNSFILKYIFHYMPHISVYVIIYFSKVLYSGFVISI